MGFGGIEMRCDRCKEQAQDGFDLCRVCMEKFMEESK